MIGRNIRNGCIRNYMVPFISCEKRIRTVRDLGTDNVNLRCVGIVFQIIAIKIRLSYKNFFLSMYTFAFP